MKRFKTITAICLTTIFIMIAGNAYYLYSLYNSIKTQTVQTIDECIRRADILEIISRLNGTSYGHNDSFIRLTLVVEGEKSEKGGYDYPGLFGNLGQTMSSYFHIIEKSDSLIPDRDYALLDSIFVRELDNVGLHPEKAMIRPYSDGTDNSDGFWSTEFSVYDGQRPIYIAYFSALNGHILRQMSGIISTLSGILVITAFLIWYLLHWVGKLRTIEQMKDDFTHNMTHELKTPVAVAYSAADSMLRYYDQSDETRNKQFLKIIIQKLGFLSGMIENILSMSMERFKKLRLDIETVAVKPLVEEIAGMIELKTDKPVNIYIDIPDNLTVLADSIHLGNVISNLIDNAVKYSYDSVDISVNATPHSISISDNGIGIGKDDLPYIFDKFYRVSCGNCYEVGGYGLGLFYVRQIITLLGWDIGVESKLGKGTTFTINFRNNEKGQSSFGRR